jgi:alginate O-acetyltransferase complex protein AlgI
MLFNSSAFLIFFVVVTALFFSLPHKFRWILLLAASCFFYLYFKAIYILILAFTILIDYYAGIKIEEANDPGIRKSYLVLSLIANIGILAVFKYYNFINGNISGLYSLFGYTNPIPYLKILLPIGLSFHTFQAMSYTIEVYRGNQRSEKHFGIYALYVMFYPQLVAGPIERPQNILHQFYEKKSFDYDRVLAGLRMMLLGFFKKVVIADRLSVYVDSVYGDIGHANSISVAIAMVFFAFEIYCDFSGYSDIAIGAAKVMGYHLMTNFNSPYSSTSITEFWRKWHISLSTWLRDYLYIPLGGNRKGEVRQYINLFIIFFISGLWHGAGWTFIIWGLLHAVAVSYESITKKLRKRMKKMFPVFIYNKLSQLLVFIFLCFTWVFFRAESFDKVKQIFKTLFSFNFHFNLTQLCAEKGPLNLVLSFFVLFLFYFLNKLYKSKWGFMFSLLAFFLLIILGKDGSKTFIYFQF